MPVNGLRVAAGVVTVTGALVAGFLLISAGGDEPPQARDKLALGPTTVRKSVLVDTRGAVLEEFSGDCADSKLPYLCKRVREELLALDGRLLTRGGLTIETAIDQRMQQAAQQAIDRHVGRDDKHVAVQAMVVPGSGEIRALATSRGPGDARGIQQGTTAMVYTLAAALEAGMRFEDGFPYSDRYRAPSYAAFKNCADQAIGDPAHSVVNRKGQSHDAFTTLRSGTWAAENTFFLKVSEHVGLCKSVEMAKRLGLARADGMKLAEFETFTLGVNEVDPVSVATTYATLAAHGKHCEPMAVTEVRDGSRVLHAVAPRCRAAVAPEVADAVTDVLSGALARSRLKGLGRDAAGMDGTTDNYASAWYAGYTPDLASAVALGAPGGPNAHRLIDVTIGGRRYAYVTGTSIPGPIWKASMTAALGGAPETAFTKPDTARFGGCRDRCAQ
ncbi:hypothetical protein ACTWPT_11960 [Nonomuraea sp. 3N208]|uniref:hypothetical protein n=1 Tax=Nonomuraea sp. 3N208 TaxID=3457421 RepID=UPI003FCE888E